MFEESLTESSRHPHGRKGVRTLLLSALVHGTTLALLLLLPLIYYQGLTSQQLLTYLAAEPLQIVAPPPAPPAPPAAPPASRPQNQGTRVIHTTAFEAPTEIPRGIPDPPDQAPDSNYLWSQYDQSPGGPVGFHGGIPAFAPGALQPGVVSIAPPPPPPPTGKREPIRVSELQNSKLIRRVEPVYPPLAIKVHLEGVVLLQATIDELGVVTDVKVLRGKALLTQAAVDAVRQWRYSPTILNGEPMPVVTTITVNFKLSR